MRKGVTVLAILMVLIPVCGCFACDVGADQNYFYEDY
jgi:hypothetical protein